jgi:hypothetical protein
MSFGSAVRQANLPLNPPETPSITVVQGMDPSRCGMVTSSRRASRLRRRSRRGGGGGGG